MYLMKLKIEKIPSYLSSSSCIEGLKRPNTFYLKRLLTEPLLLPQSSIPAFQGSYFDYLIKEFLGKERPNWSNKITKLFQELKLPESDKELIESVSNLFFLNYKLYVLPNFKYHFHDIELHHKFNFRGINFYAKLDAVLDFDGVLIPFDWKLTGSNSSCSPEPKYSKMYDSKGLKPAHKDYTKDIEWPSINTDWAIQLCIYGWTIGYSKEVWEPFKAMIHQTSQTSTGVIRTTEYLANISVEYQKKLFSEISDFYNTIINGSFIDSLASKYFLSVVKDYAIEHEQNFW